MIGTCRFIVLFLATFKYVWNFSIIKKFKIWSCLNLPWEKVNAVKKKVKECFSGATFGESIWLRVRLRLLDHFCLNAYLWNGDFNNCHRQFRKVEVLWGLGVWSIVSHKLSAQKLPFFTLIQRKSQEEKWISVWMFWPELWKVLTNYKCR